MMKTILAYIKSYQATILVTKSLKQEPFVLNFFQTSYIHSSHLCSHSNVPLSFPNVVPSVFWSTEMTANPNQHWKGENHTSVSRFVTRIVERSNKRSSLQRNKSQCSSLNTFGMGKNNNNVEHHTQSVTMDKEKDVDAMYRKIHHRAPSCYSLKKQPTFQDTTTGSPEKWHLRNERRNSILMMY